MVIKKKRKRKKYDIHIEFCVVLTKLSNWTILKFNITWMIQLLKNIENICTIQTTI